MSANQEITNRKKDHIKICLNEDVNFNNKTNGLDKYTFEHNAATEVIIDEIDLSTEFFGQNINYPFLISSITGGSDGSVKINENLAEIANRLSIPIGVGSQRQSLHDNVHHESYEIIKKVAGSAPVLANIGAAQVAKGLTLKEVDLLINLINASALIVHLNPVQELVQKEGETEFKGLLNSVEELVKLIEIPIIIKEVGSGISKSVAERFLNVGVKGIDVAGAGGTSWAGVEYLRNNEKKRPYWNWGLPTSYCLRTVRELKKDFEFNLIGSGGITNGEEIAKAIALGADITASANTVLKSLLDNGVDATVTMIEDWFKTVKEIMYLTGSSSVIELQKVKLIKDGDIY